MRGKRYFSGYSGVLPLVGKCRFPVRGDEPFSATVRAGATAIVRVDANLIPVIKLDVGLAKADKTVTNKSFLEEVVKLPRVVVLIVELRLLFIRHCRLYLSLGVDD